MIWKYVRAWSSWPGLGGAPSNLPLTCNPVKGKCRHRAQAVTLACTWWPTAQAGLRSQVPGFPWQNSDLWLECYLSCGNASTMVHPELQVRGACTHAHSYVAIRMLAYCSINLCVWLYSNEDLWNISTSTCLKKMVCYNVYLYLCLWMCWCSMSWLFVR